MPLRFALILPLILLVAAPAAAQDAAAIGGADDDDRVVRTLEELVEDALQHALTLRTSELDVRVAEAGLVSASGLFDPLLSLNPTFGRTDGRILQSGVVANSLSENGGMTTSVSGLLPWSTRYAVQLGSQMSLEDPVATQNNEREWDNTLSVNVTQPLLQGFGGAAGADQRRAAHLAARAARARHSRQVETLLADIETSYLQLAQRDAEERAARASLERAKTLLDRNEELHELERISELDLISSRSGVAQRRRAVIEARQLRRDAADRLISLVYGEQATHYLDTLAPRLATTDVDVTVPDLPAPAESAERAAATRRDVEASRLDRQQQETLLGTASNRLLPDLSVGATYTTTGTNTARAFQFDPDRDGDFAGDGWSASLSFSLPVFNRQNRGLYEQSRALVRQSDFFVTAAENLARVDARIAHRAIRVGQEVLAEADEALELVRAHYEGERERRRLGLSDSFRLLQVEEDMAAAELAEIEAHFSVLLAVTQYELAVGGVLLEKYDVPEYFLSY